MGARVATMATGSAITWMTYESCKRWLGRWQQGQPQQQLAAGSGLQQRQPGQQEAPR
jgi:hypothetical protein